MLFNVDINTGNHMTALSLHIPDKLAKESQEAAEELGVSRTEFIRQALIHELENFHAQREREAIAKCFAAMRKNPDYMKTIHELDKGFDSDRLPDDEGEWWTGKK